MSSTVKKAPRGMATRRKKLLRIQKKIEAGKYHISNVELAKALLLNH